MEYKTPDLPQDNYEGSAGSQAPHMIEPCTTVLCDDGNLRPGMFHLLECGHIVAIDGQDTRCGINCQETVNIPQSSNLYDFGRPSESFQPPTHSLSLTAGDLLHLPTVQRPSFLYCEVCQGIPWDNYKRMQPPSDDLPRSAILMPRRCLGLTRGEIVAAMRVPDAGVEVLLASPFSSPHCYAHNLCCGHRVWCRVPRDCARNCSDDWPCHEDGVRRLLVKQADVVFCEECIFRAERVHARWEEPAAARSLGLTYV